MPEEQTSTEKQHCSLLRRLAAIVYDLLLLLAVWFMVTLIIVIVNRGAAINPGNVIYSLVLLIMGFGFFGWFWTHGGQTLGMRAWRIRIQSTDGTPVSWQQAAVRFLTSLLSWMPAGLGFIWSLFDKNHMAWHDRISGTELIVIPKKK